VGFGCNIFGKIEWYYNRGFGVFKFFCFFVRIKVKSGKFYQIIKEIVEF